ncbi:MAG: hypothetical protein OEV40_01070 [Acidimicrobiia bacterium]|nr:hypothetical protein [Acidimicrobiia bacterium]
MSTGSSNEVGADQAGSGLDLEPPVRAILDAAWRPPGFSVPNPGTYPHQWLWDSCFHSLIWLALGDDRSATELGNALANQDPMTGFVPHLTYWDDPTQGEAFWRCRTTSSITQPPMFGHAAARLAAGGVHLDDDIVTAIRRGLAHLLIDRPRTAAGLVPVFHPWETGCDDSPRWDDHGHPPWTWWQVKGDIVAELAAAGGIRDGKLGRRRSGGGRRFEVGSIGFNALVVWNTRQLLASPAAGGAPEAGELTAAADELAVAIADRWEPSLATWVDDGQPSGQIRTLDALLALLVDPRPAGFEQLADPDAFAAPFGPRGVHRAEPTYEPDRYWRGPAWPQLTYLLWWAASQAGRAMLAEELASCLIAGALASGFAEYWNPETGAGLGAAPQTWTGLALVVEAAQAGQLAAR